MTNKPYDDVFRTMLNDCGKLIIPVINEVFAENYTGNEEIVFSPNEHFINRQAGGEQERITDTMFKILGEEEKKYHLECQSTPDGSMLVRFFEYDAQIALDDGKIEEYVLTVTFPHSAVLFLRHNQNTPDKMRIEIRTPGTNAYYEIPVIKSQKYTIDEIFQKQLLFLIPFYIFSHEKQFDDYEENLEMLGKLKAEYEGIRNRLENLRKEEKISEYVKCMLLDMSNKVLENLAGKYENILEGVKSIMVGKVLEYEAKTIYNEGVKKGEMDGEREGRREGRLEGRREGRLEGRREGRQEGRLEGKFELLFELVQDNVLSLREAAFRAGLSEAVFQEKMKAHSK